MDAHSGFTIALGTLGSADAYFAELKKIKNIALGAWVIGPEGLLNKTTYAQEKRMVGLTFAKVGSFGFTEPTARSEVYAKAQLSHDLCPAEVGPALRVAFVHQPVGQWLCVAMEPLSVEKRLIGFQVGCLSTDISVDPDTSKLHLFAGYNRPEDKLDPELWLVLANK